MTKKSTMDNITKKWKLYVIKSIRFILDPRTLWYILGAVIVFSNSASLNQIYILLVAILVELINIRKKMKND